MIGILRFLENTSVFTLKNVCIFARSKIFIFYKRFLYRLWLFILKRGGIISLVKSGVPGFDQALKGGFPEGAVVLLTGAPGTGKTLFALQFLIEGVKNNEPCLYITSEETADSLKETCKSIGVDISKEKNFIIYEQDVSSKILSLEKPLSIIKGRKVKRVILDSLTLFEYVYHESEMDFRKGILNFIKRVKEYKATMIATSERLTVDLDKMRYLPQDFIFEGLITVTRVRKSASFERVVTIEKMRSRDHSLKIMPFTISKTGVTVLTNEIPFSLLEFDENKRK